MTLVAAVQFVNILDFIMVMPLGPDFAADLHIPISHLGYITGSYTASACIAGLLGSLFLDRFDRRLMLFLAMLGLGVATASGAMATGLESLIACRVGAGFFGGPAAAISLAIISDVVPPERRGRAMGSVIAAFSVASIVGVPAGLELARLGSWHWPFLGVGTLALCAAILSILVLPPLREHMHAEHHPLGLRALLHWKYILALSTFGLAIYGIFLLIPNLAAYFQFNLGWPRNRLSWLYLVGGCFSLIVSKWGGLWTDRKGPTQSMVGSSILMSLMLVTGFIFIQSWMPPVAIFTLFMVGSALRNVSLNTVISHIPPPNLRARYMSIQSAVQHALSAAGAMTSSVLLQNEPSGKLIGIPRIAAVTLVTVMALPFLVRCLEHHVSKEDLHKPVPSVPIET